MFKITELYPTPVLHDFKLFMETLKREEATLSPKNQYLGRDLLWDLNQKVRLKVDNVTPRLDQASYPLFHLFYHLSLDGKLAVMVPGKGEKFKFKVTERFQDFLKLSDAEQYIYLLEILWTDTDWRALQKTTYNFRMSDYAIASVWQALAASEAGKTLDLQSNSTCGDLESWGYFLWYFSFFGFWHFTCDEEALKFSRRNIIAATLTPTEFGKKIASILYESRDYLDWNNVNKRRGGRASSELGLNSEEFQKLAEIRREGLGEPFFKAFIPLVEARELTRTLPREPQKFMEGTYTFKISLRRGVWRRIELAAKHSLHDLHMAIQEAFEFNNDHLYAFFMDNKKWSSDCYNSPDDDNGPYADEMTMGNLQLYTGKTFLYLFDYGDEWEFKVECEEISQDKSLPLKPRLIGQKGEAPSQYDDWSF